jgi:hypothetical protein
MAFVNSAAISIVLQVSLVYSDLHSFGYMPGKIQQDEGMFKILSLKGNANHSIFCDLVQMPPPRSLL